jgi:hypothetical protein
MFMRKLVWTCDDQLGFENMFPVVEPSRGFENSSKHHDGCMDIHWSMRVSPCLSTFIEMTTGQRMASGNLNMFI